MTATSPVEAADVVVEPSRFQAFHYANFRLLWIGSAFTSGAMWIQQTTLGWVAYDLTGSGSILGGMNGVRSISMLVVAPLAGVALDRLARNHIVAVSQLSLTLVTSLLALAFVLDILEVWHLFLFMMLAGIANTFNMPARQTMVFDVVPRTIVPNAIALNNLAGSMTRMLGPMVGGAMIVALGAATNFSIQALAYLCVALTALTMKLPQRPSRAFPRRAIFSEMAEGYAYVAKTQQTRLLILMMLINPIFFIPLHLALLPMYAKDILDGGAGSLGIMFGALGGGGVLGGLLTASFHRVDQRGLLQLAGLAIHGSCHAVFAVVAAITGNLWLSVPFLIGAGAAEALHNTTNMTVIQLIAPESMRGRITSAMQLSTLFMSIGVFGAGVFADLAGAPAVGLLLSLAGLTVVVMIFIFSPRMRNLRISQLNREAEARETAAHL